MRSEIAWVYMYVDSRNMGYAMTYLEVILARPRGKLMFFADNFVNLTTDFLKEMTCLQHKMSVLLM